MRRCRRWVSTPFAARLLLHIEKGLKYYLISLNRASDFLTADPLEGWKRLMEDPNMTKNDLRRAYKIAQSKIFSGKQRDTIFKLLTRKTMFNNQIQNLYVYLHGSNQYIVSNAKLKETSWAKLSSNWNWNFVLKLHSELALLTETSVGQSRSWLCFPSSQLTN